MMFTLRNAFAILALGAAAASAGAQQKVDISRAVAKDVAITFQGPFANLKVIAWPYDSVSITGTLQPGAQIQNVFAGDPGVRPRGAKVYIIGPEGMTKGGAFIEMRVPRMARVWIKGGTAEVSVTGVGGELDITLVGGFVNVSGLPRALTVEAMDANVTIDGNVEWARIRTAAGNITARGRALDALFHTVTGNVHVESTLERATFETLSGSLTFGGELARGAAVEFESHSGAIDVVLNPKVDVDVYALTMLGSIENLLTSESASAPRSGRGQELELETSFGDGRVKIQSYKGNIRIGRMK